MCNFKHVDEESKVQSIPESGTGWKIFKKVENELCSMTMLRSYQKTRNKIKWFEAFGDGFCFFLSKAGANKCLTDWLEVAYAQDKNFVVKKIKYSGGLQSHLERKIIFGNSYRVSLCKEFEIL